MITLLVSAILIAIVTELVHGVYIHTSMAHSYKDAQQASLLALGGVDTATAWLKERIKTNPHVDTSTLFNGQTKAFQLEEGEIEVRIGDEHGKVSLNPIVYPNGLTNEKYYQIYTRLLQRLNLDETLADTLADWIDIDDESRQRGAELFYYKRLPHPYIPKNGYIDSIGELPMIKGYDLKNFTRLSPLVTPYTNGLININTASRDVLFALTDEINEGLVDSLIRFREQNPFKDKSDILKVSGFETLGFALQDKITVTSNIFRFFSRATVNEAVREVEAVVQIDEGNVRIRYWRER
ncbi:MAG: type II secretion system minor pseudopilin GspK [Deltaproteobacteria bacterium]|nr:type II secretion system minor pseudopilin GspK [Deltaproteobacteria bacterium]